MGVAGRKCFSFLKNPEGGTSGGLAVKTPHYHCRGCGFDPWLLIFLQAVWCGQKMKKKKIQQVLNDMGRNFFNRTKYALQ